MQKWVWENKWEDRGALSKAERLLSKAGRLLSEHALPGWPYNKKHMNNDALILGFNFEPKDEGIRYMKHNKNVISFLLAIQWLSQIW
jgi:hypothetical protein